MTRKFLSILMCLGMAWNISQAQIYNPVKWTFESNHVEGNQYDLIFKAKIDDGWNIYSQYLESDDGPIKTSFVIEEPANLKMVGKNKETSPKRKEGFDKMFEMNVIKFSKSATFTQRVEVTDYKTPISGYLEFMACDAEKCLPPSEVDFSFELDEPKKAVAPAPAPKPDPVKVDPPKATPSPVPSQPAPKPAPAPKPDPVKVDPPKAVTTPVPSKPIASNEKPKEEPVKETEVEEKKKEATETVAEAEAATDTAASTEGSGILNPVKWTVSNKKVGDDEYEISFNAKIDKGWHTYSQFIKEGGPIPASFVYDESGADNFEILGEAKEVSDHKEEGMDPFFDMNLIKFKEEVSFIQRMKVKDTSKPLKGFLEYMACDKEKCLPPAELDFLIDLSKDNTNVALLSSINTDGGGSASEGWVTNGKGTPTEETFNMTRFVDDCSGAEIVKEKRSHWQTFIKGIIGGFIALLTPCVFPMIPLTVSYFLKGGKDKKKGFRDAFIYGLAIIVLYTGLGTIVTGIFGADALNAMASNPWFNLGLAVLLVVFALSFFGYFNLELPAKWVDKTDAISDKGGLIGILGMAATLAIVSFSCTGPLIGVLLVDAVSQAGDTTGIPLGPIVGMFGFSLALALPFSLFAAFPSWLSSLPKSGGWMDDVKVSVGFIEVALALKFLAVFSLIMESKLGFKVLPYEVFVGLWVVIALLWALYFFNMFKFKKDPYASTEKKKLPMTKMILGVLLLALAGWNMMGFQTSEAGTFHPTALMSGLAPPSCHSYVKPCECPHDITCYHDYYVAKKAAKEQNKPLFIDFTGYSCENCRRNEESIWPAEGVIEKLRDDYIVVSLYVDEREKLPEVYKSELNGRRRTVGQKWADFQMIHMGSNTQPLYVLATVNDDNTATVLNKPLGNLISDSKVFESFLECGLKVHEEIKPKK